MMASIKKISSLSFHNVLIILLIWISPCAIYCQKESAKKLYTIEGKFDYFTTDNLGKVYSIRKDAMIRYFRDTEPEFKYSNKRLGDISSVDFNFSLKPILFYLDQSLIVMLDNTLSEQGGTIDLKNVDLDQVTLICSSINNHFWLYDTRNLELIRVDRRINRVFSSGNLAQLAMQKIEPNFMLEWDNYLYLNNPTTGILVFDIFGTYYKTIPIVGLTEFQIQGDEIIYHKEDKLYRYHLKTFREDSFELPLPNIKQARVFKNFIYLLDEKGVSVFRL
jgi:hypothetical protein